jgi:hypothetical protein
MIDREPAARLMVRAFTVIAGGLVLAIGVLGFFPGYEVYRHGTLDEVRAVSNAPHWLLGVVLASGALGVHVWRRPRIANVLLWSLLSVGLFGFALAFTSPPLDLAYRDSALARPAATLANGALLGLIAIQIVVLPVACGVFALVVQARRARRPRPARLPVATVYRR